MKKILAVALTLLVSVGAVCAQVCDVNCELTGSRAAVDQERQTGASGHCHQKSPSPPQLPEPEQKQHSSDCQSHSHTAAQIKSGQSTFVDSATDCPVQFAALFDSFSASLDRRIDGRLRPKPDPSPPAPPRHSILRI